MTIKSMKNTFLCQTEKSKSSVNFLDLSSSSSPPVVDGVCFDPTSEDDHHLYKRRRTDKKCHFVPTNANGNKNMSTNRNVIKSTTDGNERKSTTKSSATFGDISPRVQKFGEAIIVPSDGEVSKSETNIVEYATKYKDPAEASKRSSWKNSPVSLSTVVDRKSISISSRPSYINHKVEDSRDCSLSDTESFMELTSREVCISLLERDIVLIEKSELSSTSATLTHDDNESKTLFACKSCGSFEDPCRMLICDCCEEAFHLLCCHRRIKKIPDNNWYCLDCSRKKPKKQREMLPSAEGSAKHIQRPLRVLRSKGDMLMNGEPYDTQVRIGRNFQAEVPEWSGPISGSDDYFVEPAELDATEMTNLSLSLRREDKKISIGNWIQCQEVLDSGAICGKWRRAPLFLVQSSDWDCSCSVLWDPIHADCAVPQELDTAEVLEQLNYINKLKLRLDSYKQKKP
ncbi:uncharacterized protein LOC123407282 isoform X3 [Hordeum vulgare subsp. vulgare]|uniref:uncharacterized protein LOC123407282 isoform X3 n=1 Tax=Hordeum vulgare subsp. vulgare TaxID=112509 RepID=UPI000295CECA|nr:uncharacterized protein LOC123407282 isoform X3 [Hordeum vulgare subsp. vulgare]